jgi:Bacterial protein of unknown function (DUF853)
VGVVFVTQNPTDVPDEVLGQLGSRVQHQLRAAGPNDAKALKASVNTYPTSSYDDLGKVILSLGIGEAVDRDGRARCPDAGGLDAAARPAVPDGLRSEGVRSRRRRDRLPGEKGQEATRAPGAVRRLGRGHHDLTRGAAPDAHRRSGDRPWSVPGGSPTLTRGSDAPAHGVGG